jgi:hypothetical protein
VPRAELDDLRAYLRLLVGDPSGASETFTDDDLDRFLLDHRIGRYSYALAPNPTPDGRFLVYTGPPAWAADAELVNTAGTVLNPDSSDLVAGEFRFAATTPPPVYASGSTYDVHLATVGVARAWIGKLKLSEFDLKVGEIELSKQQKIENLRVLIEEQLAESAALASRLAGGVLGGIPITRLDTRNVRGERSGRRRRRYP